MVQLGAGQYNEFRNTRDAPVASDFRMTNAHLLQKERAFARWGCYVKKKHPEILDGCFVAAITRVSNVTRAPYFPTQQPCFSWSTNLFHTRGNRALDMRTWEVVVSIIHVKRAIYALS